MRRLTFLTGLLLSLASACTRISGMIPAPTSLPTTGTLHAGAAKVDLTPIPGFAMGGHSIGGTVARGYWTRLFARAIYLEDAAGNSIVLVSCDLWSMPAGLGDRVAEILASEAGVRHLGRGQIVLAATHTHQSPGNFSSARLYNDFAQRWAGFDDHLFEFLAHRIATAISEAFTTRQPATVRWLETSVPGLARNRSFEAFVLNPESRQILRENANLPGGQVYQAVNPQLTLLRFDTSTTPPKAIAVAAFVAVHPTSMSAATEVYNSDLFGVAATIAEHTLHPSSALEAPVVALFNGAEGDISPAWEHQDRRNTLRLGHLLAAKMVEPGTVFTPLDVAITHRFRVVPLAKSCFMEKSLLTEEQGTHCTAETALTGVATLGGAEDGRTVLYELGWQEGIKGQRLHDQGVKQPALDPTFLTRSLPFSITHLLASSTSVPDKVPLGVYYLGPRIVIATLPGEFTMVMGRRIAETLQQALTPRPDRVLLVGLAHEYVSYFTTPQEYEAQHYEGASTLYGPYAGPLIGDALRQLATAQPSPTAGHSFHYRPGRSAHFGLRDVGAPPYTPDDGLSNIAQDLQTGLPIRNFPQFCWQDAVPELPMPYHAGTRVTPQVAIERRAGGDAWDVLRVDGIEETDRGLDFITIAASAEAQHSTWCAIWMPPAAVDTALTFRFRVQTLHGPSLCSGAFQLQNPSGSMGQGNICRY